MKPFCEVIVTSILPAIRSILTRELMGDYRLTQKETADLLGLTQPAISQYQKECRGAKVKLLEKQPKIMKMIDELAKDVSTGKIRPKQLQLKFCGICKTVRENKIICKLHQDVCPSIAPCYECPKEC
jgi:predicted transcriptional regulator